MHTVFEHHGELGRALGRLGIGPLELVASMRDEILVLDGEGRVVFVLGDWADETPRTLDALMGKTVGEICGRQAAAVHEAAEARALRGEPTTYEWTRRKGREPQRLSTTASPLRDSNGDIVGVVHVTRNISASHRAGKRGDTSAAQKTTRLLEIERGIQQLAGAIESYRNAEHAPPAFGAGSPLHQLSSRERQVLSRLAQGYRPRSIAEHLHVSPETVRNHLKAMFKKTGTHSQEELTALLRASGRS
jgi:PAS domain S-box-containing protein